MAFFIEKMRWFYPPPQRPPRFARHVDPKSYLQVTSEKPKKNYELHAIYDFSSKNGILYWTKEVVFPPQDPQDWPGMAHLDPKSYLQVSSEKPRKEIWPCEICASKNEFLFKNGNFYWINEVVLPPRTAKVFSAWLIWAPNLTYKSPLRNRKKIWPPC